MSAIEIERKFLLERPPSEWIAAASRETIRQGYLLVDKTQELRIRQKGDQYWMTLKQGEGLQRNEQECLIPEEQFTMLWPLTRGRQIEKTRYTIEQSGYLYEIDVFSGALKPLVLLEVEFDSIESSRTFPVPDIVTRDVTEDKRYKNAALALNGLPG